MAFDDVDEFERLEKADADVAAARAVVVAAKAAAVKKANGHIVQIAKRATKRAFFDTFLREPDARKVATTADATSKKHDDAVGGGPVGGDPVGGGPDLNDTSASSSSRDH